MFNKIGWRINSLLLLVFIISLFISPVFVSAQEEVPFVSTVNIHDVTYKQVDNTFEMVFSLSNREGVQPDVRYGVLLKQQTPKGDLIIDERAESETLTLGPNEQVVRSVTYLAPKVLEGDYTLYIVAKNNDGAFFAIQKVDNIKLSRATEIGVYIDPSSCYLTVSGDEAATKYTTKDAITLNEGEIVTSHCMVENIGSSPLELNPLTATYRRSVFGSEIQTQPVEASAIKLQPKEKVEVSTILPRAIDPQSYVVRLGYGFMSNTVMYAYAVKGESGSVRNIRLDKDGYKSGETATILFDWSGPVDNLFTTRGESDSKLQDPKVFISLNTKTGESCGESVLYSLAGSRSHIIKMPISGDCPEPDVSIVLSDSMSGALGEYIYAIDKTPEAEEKIIDTTDNKFMFYVYLLVAVSVIAIVLLFVLSIKKHKDSNTIPPVAPLIFVLMFGSFLMLAPEVKAESIEFGSTRFVTFTATLDKTRYEPNEIIRITGLATLDGVEDCGDMGLPANCNADKSVSLKIGNQTVLSGALTAIPLTGSIEVTADGSVGNKTLQFTATNQGQTRNFSIPYEVYSQAASCSGSIPDNARAAESLDNSPLSGGMSWHHVTENSADRCEFICNPNYNWENGSCVANSGSGSGSGSSGVYSVTVVEPQICSPQTEKGTTLTWTVPQGQYALFTSSGYQSVMVQGSGSVSDFPATLTPVTLSMYSCTGNTESTCTSLKDTVVVKGTSEGCGGSSSGVAVQFCTSGNSNCPVISASGEGVTPGTALYPGYSVLFNKTLSLSVSGLSSGAEMCKVFRIHPNGSYVPTPLSHAQQYCTFDSNYSPVTVSGGVARLDIPQVNPDYAVDAVYQVCFKNGGEGNKASCKFITVTPFGTVGDPDLSDGTMHCDSNHYGPDIMVYGLNWYGVHRVDEETTITMNPMQQLGDARAKWTVSAVEYNAQPGDSVSFSRTSGTFDSDTSTTNPNNKFTMTVHGSPRTVGIRISATTNQVTCESTSFSAYRQANFLYANAGNTYQCVGTRPANSYHSAQGNVSYLPDYPWRHKPSVGQLNKCEFSCDFGFKWSNPSSNLWSDGSCVPDDVTPKWHVVSATGGATCSLSQERHLSTINPEDGEGCGAEDANNFYYACNSTNGKRYSCVYPEGAEPENTWTVDQDAYIGSMAGAVDECPASYSPSMSGQSCNQPGRMCYKNEDNSSYGDVYTCGSNVPYVGIGRVLDYETRTPVSGVKIYRSHSGAILAGFDDGLCTVSNSSGSYRLSDVKNMQGTNVRNVEVLSGDNPTGPTSRLSCYNTDYVYWEGGQINYDQATMQNGERIIPIQDVLVRRVTATTQKADLVSADLEIPATAYSGKTFTVRAKSKNEGGGATDVGYQNTFSYRIGQSGNWNILQTFDSPAIGAGSVNDVLDTYTLSIDTKGATQLVYIKHCVNTGLKKAAELSDENNCTERGPIIVTPYTGKVWSKTAIGNSTSLPGLCDLSIEKQPRLGAGCSEEAGYSCLAGDFVYKCVSSNQ